MDFSELLDYCKGQAILNTLESTEVSVWRSLCRKYSEKFHTPLHLVFELDPEEVMIAVFEEQMDSMDVEKDIESLLDTIYSLEDPEYDREKRKELKEFIKKAEAEEEERVRLGKPIHPDMKNHVSLNSMVENELPMEGGIDLSHLDDENNR